MLEIVEAPLAFPPAEYDGLVIDAEEWPPLLHPQMLMDFEGYTAWEQHMVSRCAHQTASPESVIATLLRDARVLRAYQPESGPLTAAVNRLPLEMIDAESERILASSLDRFREVMAAVPDEFRPEPDEQMLAPAYEQLVLPEWRTWKTPLNRYLAAKAFASWTAYQGRGVISIVRGLEVAMALVRVEAARQCRNANRVLDQELLREAIRSADFMLNHLAVGEDLAADWSQAEAVQPVSA